MRIDYARVSTTEQNLGLQPDDLKAAYDASVDPTNGTSFKSQSEHRSINRGNIAYDHSSPARAMQALATLRSVTFHLEGQAERRS